ncbi:MAG TPA: fumarylacetoacetase [Chthoniobacterales bacterium]|jgi:fumarylacetoacetase|nr:fumarylacetoacetase [Chthoniobacterales bacterium]
MPAPSRSFIEVSPESDFPLQNLPYGIFRPNNGRARAGVAIGDLILDLAVLEEGGYFRALNFGPDPIFGRDSLNAFLALGRPTWRKTREILQHLLAAETATLRDNEALRTRAFHRQAEVKMLLPARIGDYTDFYSSYHHAFNVGTMFRGPENALMPNWKHLPIAYHGRASSIVPSGADVRRPHGQIKPPDAETPIFSATRALDFELETAFFVGPPNELGEPVPVTEAADHIFGFVLMNDWSARDIQTWEYQPLGPFLAKNFCTSISPWIVTLEALEPFRKPLPAQDPAPMEYLRAPDDFTFDIHLEVELQTVQMRAPQTIARSNFQNLYWSIAQQLAHHTIGGCNLQPGDLLASGTISGPTEDARGSMLELTWRGANPLQLPGGETRKWLEDGDRLTIRGWAEGDGYRVGFGEVMGRIVA